VIAAYIVIQAEVGPAAIAAAALRHVPGISQAASLAGRYDVIAGQARDTGEPAGLVASRIQALDDMTPAMTCPVVYL
jgi:hypothetical protein